MKAPSVLVIMLHMSEAIKMALSGNGLISVILLSGRYPGEKFSVVRLIYCFMRSINCRELQKIF